MQNLPITLHLCLNNSLPWITSRYFLLCSELRLESSQIQTLFTLTSPPPSQPRSKSDLSSRKMVILTNLFPLLLSLTPILAPCQSPSITPDFCNEAKYSALEPYPYGESFETGFCAGLSFKLGTCGLFPSPSLPRQKFGMGLIWGWDRYLGFIFQALLMRRWWVICICESFSSLPLKIFQTGVDTWKWNDRTSNCSGAYYGAQDGDNDLGKAFFDVTTFGNLVGSWMCVDAWLQ